MKHRTTKRMGLAVVGTLLLAAAVAMSVLVAYPTLADAQEIDVTPMAINVTVPYGETVTRTLTIQNQGSADLLWRDNRGRVTQTLPVPGGYDMVFGLASDGTYLYVLAHHNFGYRDERHFLGKMNQANGAWLGWVEYPFPEGSWPRGMAWDADNQRLLVASSRGQQLFALDPQTCQVTLHNNNLPIAYGCEGVALGDGYLWVNEPPFWKCNPATGAGISSCTITPATPTKSVEYFHGALWTMKSTSFTTPEVFKVDPTTGALLESFPAPSPTCNIVDLATTGMNDDRLWMLAQGNNGEHKVYLVETCDSSWLRRSTHSGTVPGGGSQTMTLTLDSIGAGVGVHTATVTILANDGDEPTTDIPVTFTVTPVGRPPVIVSAAWADPNPVPMLATTVRVVASDPDGDPLTYAWSKVSGFGTVTFATAAAANSGVTFSFKEGGSYVLRVTVSDDKGNSVSSDVQVRVALDIRADVNQDGVVNALDSQILIENLGKTVPQ